MISCAHCDLTRSAVHVLADDMQIHDPVCCETDTDGCGGGFFPDDGGPE